jgi:hypothetical protein
VGEQFIDLFTAGGYALVGRMYSALAQPSLSWVFYLLASAGILSSLLESAVDERPDFWLRHLLCVCLAAVLTLMPQQIDLSSLTYGAPGAVESAFGTRTGAAPHLTVWIERLGANAAVALRNLTERQPTLAIPGIAAQVAEIASDPASLNDGQLRANLEIWRQRVVPQLLSDHPELAQQLRDARLMGALLNPRPSAPQFVGQDAANSGQAVQSLLARSGVDLSGLARQQAPLARQITDVAGADPWAVGADGGPVQIRFSQRNPGSSPAPEAGAPANYADALQRADQLSAELRAQLPGAGASVPVQGLDQLYDLLGRSLLYNAGVTFSADAATRATLGSLCQRSGYAACRAALAPLVDASGRLHVPQADRYNTSSWTSLLQQPISSLLLLVTSLLLKALSTLVVSVLPFALGIAKALAILVSMLGTWLLLWPGRARVALTWMLGPISFVSLWSVLFNLWADIEPGLSQLASLVQSSDHGSWSAVDAMSIAISLGYMGLPSLALGVVYGQSGRALYHASARIETALMMAWHTRGTAAAFGRRWLVNSPLGRRWNQRAYRAIGLGPLRPTRTATGVTARGKRAAAKLRIPASASSSAATTSPGGVASPPAATDVGVDSNQQELFPGTNGDAGTAGSSPSKGKSKRKAPPANRNTR